MMLQDIGRAIRGNHYVEHQALPHIVTFLARIYVSLNHNVIFAFVHPTLFTDEGVATRASEFVQMGRHLFSTQFAVTVQIDLRVTLQDHPVHFLHALFTGKRLGMDLNHFITF